MGRGDRRTVRWRNDRIRKKHERDKRRRETPREAPADGGGAQSQAQESGATSSD